MFSRTERRFLAGFVAASGLMLAAAALFVAGFVRGQEQDDWIDHTRHVIAVIDTAQLYVSAADLVASAAGDDVGARDRHHQALGALGEHLAELRALTRDNGVQQARLDRLEALVRLERRRVVDGTAMTGDGADVFFDQVRGSLRDMTAEERRLLTVRIQETRDRARGQLYIMLGLVALSVLVTTGLGIALKRNLDFRREVEHALRQSERRLQSVIDVAPNAVVTLNGDETIADWNPRAERLFGWQREEVRGRPFRETVLASLAPRALARLSVLRRRVERRGQAETRIPLRLRRRDGSEFPAELTLNGVLDERGEPRLTAFIDDLTVREQTQQALATARDSALAASSLKSEFLAHISHELRTPLNGIIGMAGLLRDTDLDPEQEEFAETMRRSGEHLLTIINDLLDLSKIEAGKLVLETIEFDLELATRDVTDVVLPAAREKGVELVLRMAPDVPRYLRGDVGRVRQVLMNLLGNAVKFTERGHVLLHIRVREQTEGGVMLHFSVEDTGIGVPASSRHKLFNSFSQAEASTTRRFGGTGLGLALSRQLVERMGGGIGYEDREDGGSRFWFTMPFEIGSSGRTPLSARELADARILVVDDSDAARESVEEIIASWQLGCVSVARARDALDRIRSAAAEGRPFSIALVDATLPDLRATDLAAAIRREAETSGIRLVVLTLVVGRGVNALEEFPGFDAVVAKPVRPSELLNGMASALGLRETLRPSRTRSLDAQRFDGTRVLLAEDNQVNQRVAVTMLERLGCRVDVAGNGREAVQLAGRLPYDLIFMDLQMPEMDGFEATAAIRSAEASGRRVPIVALTAHAMAGDREVGLAAGMDDYLTKPVRAEGLASMLAKFTSAVSKPSRSVAGTANGDGTIDEAVITELVDADGDLLTDLLGLFVESSREYLEAMRAGARAGDASAVSRAAHALRGSAANFRATHTVALARELEQTTGAGTLEGAADHIAELESAVASTIRSVERLATALRARGNAA